MEIAGDKPRLGLEQPLKIPDRLPEGTVRFNGRKIAQVLAEPDSMLIEKGDCVLKMPAHGKHRTLHIPLGDAVLQADRLRRVAASASQHDHVRLWLVFRFDAFRMSSSSKHPNH